MSCIFLRKILNNVNIIVFFGVESEAEQSIIRLDQMLLEFVDHNLGNFVVDVENLSVWLAEHWITLVFIWVETLKPELDTKL